MSRSKKLDELNQMKDGGRKIIIALLAGIALTAIGVTIYFNFQSQTKAQKDSTEYITALADYVYETETEVLKTFTTQADGQAYAAFLVADYDGSTLGVNYLKIDDLYLRSTYTKVSGRVVSNRLIEIKRLDTWLKYDKLQSQRLELIQRGIDPSGIDTELKKLTEEHTWLRN